MRPVAVVELWGRAGVLAVAASAALAATSLSAQSPVDPALARFIATIKAVDNHSHANSTAPGDADFDALPLDGLPAFALPARARPEEIATMVLRTNAARLYRLPLR